MKTPETNHEQTLAAILDIYARIQQLNKDGLSNLIQQIDCYMQENAQDLVQELQAKLYIASGEVCMRLGNLSRAEEDFVQGLKHCKGLADISYKIKATNGLCTLRAMHSDYIPAIEGWTKILEEITDIKTKGDILNNLGIAYSMTARYQQALDCQFQSLKIDEELQREAEIGTDYFNLATSYMKLRHLDRALELYEEAIAIFEKLDNQRYLGFAFSNLSMLYTDMQDLDKAMDNAQRSLSIKMSFGNEQDIGNTLANLGNILNQLGRFDSALEHYNKAREYFELCNDKSALSGINYRFAN
ncbi:MAG: tetratricopeptide repeat protein, partial [Candidatus Cloacimonadaceae bacterium]|nr:tetratricopeptide repeat protein [Candidatus Cloacimonadaceae bacterium]